MFIAIIFMCLTASDCGFVYSPVVESPAMCISMLKQQEAIIQENKEKIIAWHGQCIKLKTGVEI